MFDATRINESTNARHVEIHQQLDSTNDRALQLIRQNEISTPALVVAEHQTAGRGQRDRKWWSDEGSLTFSWIAPLVDTAKYNKKSIRLIPIASALAVIDAVESQSELSGLKIKWPNDIIVSSRKLCGILIETVSLGSDTAVVIGIGINVNNEDLSSRQLDSLGDRTTSPVEPTSVFVETSRKTSLENLLLAVAERLASQFDLVNSNPGSIVDRCNERLAFVGQTIKVVSPNRILLGTCEGIGTDGGLVLKTRNGVVTVYSGTTSVA